MAGIWELDSWLEALEGGEGWKKERAGVAMKQKNVESGSCVCMGDEGAKGLWWGVRGLLSEGKGEGMVCGSHRRNVCKGKRQKARDDG